MLVRRLGLFAVLGLTAVGAPSFGLRRAHAGPPVVHEGKPLERWIEQLSSKNDDRARSALRALGHAKFLVGAAELALPAIEPFVNGIGVTHFTAVGALAEYGPLAIGADATLAAHQATSIGEVHVARIRIGRDVKELLDELQGRWATAKANFLGDPTDTAASELGRLVRQGAELELRGESSVAFAAGLLQDRRTEVLVWSDVFEGIANWGPLAAPLARVAASYLTDKEPVMRGRAVSALAWMSRLSPEHEKALFKGAGAFASGYYAPGVTRGIALTETHPMDLSLALLRGRAGSGDAVVAAWASAGLARRVPDAERPKLWKGLLGQLKHANPEVRAAAADGALALASSAEPALPELAAALADPDLRVRWRIAAVLLRHAKESEAALTELARGIDSPDDFDRLAAFDAIAALKTAASPLAQRIEPWTKVPFRNIASSAERALRAVNGK